MDIYESETSSDESSLSSSLLNYTLFSSTESESSLSNSTTTTSSLSTDSALNLSSMSSSSSSLSMSSDIPDILFLHTENEVIVHPDEMDDVQMPLDNAETIDSAIKWIFRRDTNINEPEEQDDQDDFKNCHSYLKRRHDNIIDLYEPPIKRLCRFLERIEVKENDIEIMCDIEYEDENENDIEICDIEYEDENENGDMNDLNSDMDSGTFDHKDNQLENFKF